MNKALKIFTFTLMLCLYSRALQTPAFVRPGSHGSVQAAGPSVLAPSFGTTGLRKNERPFQVKPLRSGEGGGAGSPAIDEAISTMLKTGQDDLPGLVAKNVKLVGTPSFFVRVAERAEETKSDKERKKLEKLADDLVGILNDLVKYAETSLDTSQKIAQTIIASAAEPDGEFMVPLSRERRSDMRLTMEQFAEELSENFLATISTWMQKVEREKVEGMGEILQATLQIYAAIRLRISNESTEKATPSMRLYSKILDANPLDWDDLIKNGITGEDAVCDADALMTTVQLAIETIVMQCENGSMEQRVQAEFLAEIVERVRQLEAKGEESSQ
eukprot:CAMPEP_0113943614 /NCGR_PEP_ID=MMETSP1339-20121228/26925_1 /TAXON_ID=94617 /ORGANISM="Fibrocapsa japonica" /LENGTH=329 /DNA_ID=CAMNT_0000948539 /DNA_START=53 /DNA_END=1042 /DNA_ORIENTATION=+ /assembly_acc=CAM_ASM_000762